MSVNIPILTTFDDTGSRKAIKSLKDLRSTQLAGVVSAGALVNMARQSIQAANEDALSQRQLALALRNNANANDYAVAKTEAFINALQFSVAVADDELRPALATLATVTHDVGEAQKLLQTALDLSAARGIDLQTAALGLSKAYQGNVGALRRMGVAVSDTAIKNKDFNQALLEITMATKGAAQEAAKGADGGWKRLGVVLGDLSERVGANLNDNLSETIDKLNKLGIATGKAEDKNRLLNRALGFTNDLMKITLPGWRTLNNLLKDNSSKNDAAAKALQSRNNTSLALQGATIRGAKKEEEADKKATTAKKKKAAAAKEAADALQGKLKTALQAVQDEIRAYVTSIGDAISANVSLASAVSTAEDSVAAKENAMADALKRRKEAYDALNMAQMTNDVEGYNRALAEVADAEKAVGEAAAMKTTTYTEQFRNQITAAKEFGNNLKTLIQNGLGQAGVQQLLNLGAVAGNQVAKDLIDGTKGLTIGEINAGLDAVQAAGEAAGMATPGYASILGAQVGRTGNNVYITVNTGVGDKAEISKQIVALLQEYDTTMGGVPIKTK